MKGLVGFLGLGYWVSRVSGFRRLQGLGVYWVKGVCSAVAMGTPS